MANRIEHPANLTVAAFADSQQSTSAFFLALTDDARKTRRSYAVFETNTFS